MARAPTARVAGNRGAFGSSTLLVLPIDRIRLHPVLADAGLVGVDYALNDLSFLSTDVVEEALRSHPVLVTRAARRRARSARPTSSQAGSDADSEPEADARDNTVLATEPDMMAAPRVLSRADTSQTERPNEGPSASGQFFAVGGLRAWVVAAAVYAREPVTKPLGVPAIMIPREDDALILARVRVERLVESMMFSLKPPSAARTIAKLWSNLREGDPTELSRLLPRLDSQSALMSAMGYTSRFAFRSPATDNGAAAAESGEASGAQD